MNLPTTSESPRPTRAAHDAEASPFAIEAKGLSKKYELHRYRTILLKDAVKLAFSPQEKEYFWALRDVSFQVRRGEVFGVIGSNGAGKSTLLSLMAKTACATRGEIKVNGRVSALLELGAGFHPDFTGRENIYINGAVMGLSRKLIEDRMEEIIAFSELGPFIDEPVRNYSSGMLARLGFSVATSIDPDILIIDEVLAVGDQSFQEKSFNRIVEFQKRGCTILFVSHSLETVEKICQRAMLLSHGQVIDIGDAHEVCANYAKRVEEHRLEAKVSPYEKERVPASKRAFAALVLAAGVSLLGFAAAKVILSQELPEQRPMVVKQPAP